MSDKVGEMTQVAGAAKVRPWDRGTFANATPRLFAWMALCIMVWMPRVLTAQLSGCWFRQERTKRSCDFVPLFADR